jgi:hypothetical protein
MNYFGRQSTFFNISTNRSVTQTLAVSAPALLVTAPSRASCAKT